MSNDNSLIRMVEIENRGRALVSNRRLQAGEIILKESPILLYSPVPQGAAAASIYCSHCYRAISQHSPTTVCCPNCTSATLFCSPQCQSVALSTSHTPFVCQSLTRFRAADSLHPDRYLEARFLVSAYNLAMVSPPQFQILLSLQGECGTDNVTLNFLHTLMSSICPVSDTGSLGFSLELTSALLAKDKVNAFGLMEPFGPNGERSVRAYGIYPRASFFNHDCLPNACRFDYVDSVPDTSNVDIIVRVIHDLPEGKEICLSYFQVNLTYPERQSRLKEGYGFTCDCERCKVEANWSDDEEGGEASMDDDDDVVVVVDDDDMGADLEMEDCGMDKEQDDDFPHAYFFIKYVCNKDDCWGTLAPLPPADARPSTVMECNVCGSLIKSEDLMDGK